MKALAIIMKQTIHQPGSVSFQSRYVVLFLFFTVSRSKCPSYVGTSGILLQETKNAFKIITKDDKLKSKLWRDRNSTATY